MLANDADLEDILNISLNSWYLNDIMTPFLICVYDIQEHEEICLVD